MIPLIAALAASALAGAVGAASFIRHRSWRALIRSIGLVAIFLGLYFLGVAQLLVDAISALIAWIQATTWTQQMTYASIALGTGLVLAVLASYLPAGKRDPAQTPQATAEVAGHPTQAPAVNSGKKPALDSEDAEIEALLKARGIQ